MTKFVRRTAALAVLASAATAALSFGAAAPAQASDICPLGLVFDEYPSWSCVNID